MAHRHQLPDEVINAESGEIAARRKAAGYSSERLDEDLVQRGKGVVGVAISGGGIRSSTISLGVIQALERRNLLRYVDYLSTVSGGGYTGSLLSSVLRDAKKEDEAFPLRKSPGELEPPGLVHLRNGSNYLRPGGLLDTLRLPMVVLRGVLLHFLVVVAVVMVSVFITEWLYENNLWPAFELGPDGPVINWIWALYGLVPFLCLAVFYPVLVKMNHWSLKARNTMDACLSISLGLAAVVAVAIPTLFTVQMGIETPGNEFGQSRILIYSITAGSAFLCTTIILARFSKAASRFLVYCFGLSGPLFVIAMYLLLCLLQVDSPFISPHFKATLNCLGDTAAAGNGEEGTGDSRCEASTQGSTLKDVLIGHKGLRASTPLSITRCSPGTADKWLVRSIYTEPEYLTDGRVSNSACLWSNDKYEVENVFKLVTKGDKIEIIGGRLRLFGKHGRRSLMGDDWFLGLGLAFLLYILLFFDANSNSLHGFYRDRLSKLYVFLIKKGKVIANDRQKMSDLRSEGSTAPYHLINAALNMQGSAEPGLRGRQADFFVMSKRYCGGEHTGYCRTTDLERRDKHFNLGTAMAISGAAAAPNMGTTTVKPLVFLMTLLNVRLNYWLPNPKRVQQKALRTRRWPGVGYVLREAMGWVHHKTPFVNVSDGGHLENLGVYELLRRRCELIIAIDGSADPTMSFGSLMTLQRYAKIDLGVDLEMDLQPLHKDSDGRTSSHFCSFKIRYSGTDEEQQSGLLIYVKSSVTGDEPPYVNKYRDDNPPFPHQSTADQFFDEEQFEAYRALGDHMGEELIRRLDELPDAAKLLRMTTPQEPSQGLGRIGAG